MMADYTFNTMGRIGSDTIDATQRNIQNTKFSSYMLSSFFSDVLSDSHVNFALKQPTLMVNGMACGNGLCGSIIDIDNKLNLKKENERPLEKLQLMPRPFITIPYLGKGSCDSTLESRILQGETTLDKKSASQLMEKSFMGYTLYPSDTKMEEQLQHTVQEDALNGWLRGGASSREASK